MGRKRIDKQKTKKDPMARNGVYLTPELRDRVNKKLRKGDKMEAQRLILDWLDEEFDDNR